MDQRGISEMPARKQIERLYQHAAPRLFVASRSEMLELGFTSGRVDNWVKAGRLVELFRGVYSYGRDVDLRQAALRAALLAAGPGGTLTGRSACEVLGLLEVKGQIPAYVEVAVPCGRARMIRGRSPALQGTWVKVVRRDFALDEIETIDGVEVAIPVAALLDLAVKAPEREVFFVFLEACRLGFIGLDEVNYAYRRGSGRRGMKKLKPLLAMWVPELNRTRSVFEGEYLLAWLSKGYPVPQVNVKVFGREVDQYWPVAEFVLELDGGSFHSDPIARARDEEKNRYLRSKGLRVRRVTRREFQADPEGVIDQVAREAGFIS